MQNPVLFRSTAEDDLNNNDFSFIFELVVSIKHEEYANRADFKIKEYSCGWAEAPLEFAKKNLT